MKNILKQINYKQMISHILFIIIFYSLLMLIFNYFILASRNIQDDNIWIKEEFYPNIDMLKPLQDNDFKIINYTNPYNIGEIKENTYIYNKSNKNTVHKYTFEISSFNGLESSPNYELSKLSKYEQDYIYTFSQQNNIDYELLLAIFYLETGWSMDPEYITRDVAYGLGQWHKPSGTFDMLQQQVALILDIDVSDVEWDNPIHNATGTIWYLNYLSNQWKGYSEDQRIDLMLLSYNQGFRWTVDYINNGGIVSNHPYVKVVKKHLANIEGGDILAYGE